MDGRIKSPRKDLGGQNIWQNSRQTILIMYQESCFLAFSSVNAQSTGQYITLNSQPPILNISDADIFRYKPIKAFQKIYEELFCKNVLQIP